MQTPENMLLLSMGLAILLVLALLGYFGFILYKMHEQQLQLLKSRDENRLAAAEQERELIALDLHDDLGPILTAARFKVYSLPAMDEREKELQEEALSHIQLVVQRIKTWADQLAAPAVLQQSPFHQLAEYVVQIAPASAMKIEIMPFNFPEIKSNQSIHIHRMLQEIIHNAVKHAKAESMVIYGQVKDKQLIITSIDDGIGFEVGKTERQTKGNGLQNLRTRARLLKAALLIESKPGEGTKHIIKLPIS